MRRASKYQPQNRPHHHDAQRDRNFPDGGDPPIEQRHRHQITASAATSAIRVRSERPQQRAHPVRLRREVTRISRKPQRARSHAQRPLK